MSCCFLSSKSGSAYPGESASLHTGVHSSRWQALGLEESGESGPAVTLVTDSLGPSCLFGAAGTAVLLAALWAEHRGGGLRVLTVEEPVCGHPVREVLTAQGLPSPEWVTYQTVDSEGAKVILGSGERVLTTSWWTTRLFRAAGWPPERLVWLVQEDERLLYPHGDDWLGCEEMLRDPEIRMVVNTRLLFEGLRQGGVTGLQRRGHWFEPAFPETLYHSDTRHRHRPRFGFYARPRHHRNLFRRGVEAINHALKCGVLPRDWEMVFLGPHRLDLELYGGVRPRCPGRLPWDAYAEEIRHLHAGMALILTPHPGYPALDMVASGAAVVTNRYGPKQDLSAYNGNLFTVDPGLEALVQGIGLAVARARDPETLRRRTASCGLLRDWRDSFAEVLQALESD